MLTPGIAILGMLAMGGIAFSGQFSTEAWLTPVMTASIMGAFGYALAGFLVWYVLRRYRSGAELPLRHLILGSVLFSAPFFLALPVFAGDVFAYIASVKVAALGNPYAHTLATLGNDPILQQVYPGWHTLPLTYGPLWAVLLKVLSSITRDTVLLLTSFRLLGLASIIGCGFVLQRVVGTGRAALIAWNPVVLIEVVGDAHHDLLIGLAILVAIVLAARPLRSAWALAAGVALKYVPIILIPLFALAHPRAQRRFLIYASITAGIFVALTAPFWVGPQTFSGVVAQSQMFAIPVFFPQFILLNLSYLTIGAHPAPELIARLIGIVLFVLVALGALVYRKRLTLPGAAALTIAAYIVFAASNVQTWYLLWFLPVLPLLPGSHARRWMIVTMILWGTLIAIPFRLWYA